MCATTCVLWVLGSIVAPPVCRLCLLPCCSWVLLYIFYIPPLNADTNDGFPSTVGSAGHLGFVGIVPWPLTSRWCATWLELTRNGGLGEVGSLDSFLIVCHALRLLWVRSIDVMTSSHLFFFSSFIVSYQLVSSLQGSFGKRVACVLFIVCFI